MGDIMRRVVTLFEVRGAESVRASLGTMRAGFGSLRRESDQYGRSAGIVNNQLRALGTTLRYAFAGTAIFGTMQMVRTLGQFQAQLGEISAIARGPGGIPIIGRQLDELGVRLLDVSNKTTVPISELQSGVLSLYSTIGDVPENEAANMMEVIADTAITAQSNIEDTTQALLGMIDAFGRGTDEIGTFGDEFYRVIALSAGMPGHVYAQQLGKLSSAASMGRFSPEEMGALAIGATRFGGSAAVNMRGLNQLMTYALNPSGKSAEAAFASIGLGRARRNQMGGMEVLTRVFAEVNKRGVKGNARSLTDDMVNQIDTQFGEGAAPNSAIGISGRGSELLAKLFPRIEGRRIAAILSRMQTDEQVAGTKNQTITEYLNEVTNGAEGIDKAMARAMDYRRIQQASNAIHNMGIEIGTALSPILQLPARAIVDTATRFNKQTWGIPVPGTGAHISGQQAEIAGGAVGAVALIRWLNGRGGGGGAGRLLRGGGIAMAGVDALSGDSERGHSPMNPLYVAVVYSLSGGLPGGRGRGPISNRDLRTAESELGAGYIGGRPGTPPPSRLSRIRASGGGFVAGTAAMVISDAAIRSYLDTRGFTKSGVDQQAEEQVKGHKLLSYLSTGKRNAFGDPIWSHGTTKAEQDVIFGVGRGQINPDEAERRLRRLATPEQLKGAGVRVKGSVDVTIHDERTRKKVTVTTDIFPDFTTPAPQTKGKAVTRRGGSQ